MISIADRLPSRRLLWHRIIGLRNWQVMQNSALPELSRLESVLVKDVPVHVQQRLRFEWAQIEHSAKQGAVALCHSFRCSG